MSGASVSVGLVGCGRWGRHILRDLITLGARVEVVAPADETRQFALAHGAAAVHAAPPASWATEMDGFVVATPTTVHAASIDQLLPFGKPIYTEKPLCDDVSHARRLAAAAPDRLFVMDKWRYHPGICKLAALAQSGELGTIDSLRLHRLGWSTSHDDVDAAWVLVPHDLSICLHIIGTIPPLRMAARTGTLRHDGGLVAVLGGGDDPTVTLEYSIVFPRTQRSFAVVGSKASALLADSYDQTITVRRGAPGQRDVEPIEMVADGELPLLGELRAFVGHLQGGPPPLSSAADGVRIVERTAEIRRMAGLHP
ncbi:MAG: Gfo/Idh/MocA family protein [Planctomycetota bacterium]